MSMVVGGYKNITMENNFNSSLNESNTQHETTTLEQLVQYGAVKIVETMDSVKKRKNNEKNQNNENKNGKEEDLFSHQLCSVLWQCILYCIRILFMIVFCIVTVLVIINAIFKSWCCMILLILEQFFQLFMCITALHDLTLNVTVVINVGMHATNIVIMTTRFSVAIVTFNC